MLIRKSNIFLGIFLIILGISFLVSPVHYSYKFAYDLRGVTKWIASFITISVGVYSLSSSIEKGKFEKYFCHECGNLSNLKENTVHLCPHCQAPLEKL